MKGTHATGQLECLASTVGSAVEKKSRCRKPNKIKVVSLNEPPSGAVESALADVYAKMHRTGKWRDMLPRR